MLYTSRFVILLAFRLDFAVLQGPEQPKCSLYCCSISCIPWPLVLQIQKISAALLHFAGIKYGLGISVELGQSSANAHLRFSWIMLIFGKGQSSLNAHFTAAVFPVSYCHWFCRFINIGGHSCI